MLQPADAAFVRGDDVRVEGALGRGDSEVLMASLPTAIVTLVCRGRGQRGPFVLRRRLAGDSLADFEEIELDLGSERCAQIRDLIDAGTMTEGGFDYQIRVFDGKGELASGSRVFSAVGRLTGAGGRSLGFERSTFSTVASRRRR